VYALPQEVVDNPQFDAHNKPGWYLSCYACNHEWWELLPMEDFIPGIIQLEEQQEFTSQDSPQQVEVQQELTLEEYPQLQQRGGQNASPQSEKYYSDFTNLSGLMAEKRSPFASSIHPKVKAQVSNASSTYVPRMENHPPRANYIKNGNLGAISRFMNKRTYLIVGGIILFTLTLMMAVIYVFHGGQDRPNLMGMFSRMKANPKPHKPLVIRDVKYEVRPVGERKTVLVVGEVQNPHNTSIPLNSLKISIWGPCPKEQIKASGGGDKNGSCLIITWQHAWDYSTINSGERKLFQTVGSVPLSQDIERVDVTLP